MPYVPGLVFWRERRESQHGPREVIRAACLPLRLAPVPGGLSASFTVLGRTVQVLDPLSGPPPHPVYQLPPPDAWPPAPREGAVASLSTSGMLYRRHFVDTLRGQACLDEASVAVDLCMTMGFIPPADALGPARFAIPGGLVRVDGVCLARPVLLRALVASVRAEVASGIPQGMHNWGILWGFLMGIGRLRRAFMYTVPEDVRGRMTLDIGVGPAPEDPLRQWSASPTAGKPAQGEAQAPPPRSTGSSGAPVDTLRGLGMRDLVEAARRGELPPVFGREREVRAVAEVLARTEKANPVLIGEAGVGKTSVVHLLARRIASGGEGLPERVRKMRIFELDHAALVAGTGLRGQFEARLKEIVDAVTRVEGAVLFCDEIHLLVGAGQAESGAVPGAGQLLKPHLASGRLRMIGATTTDEYRVIERDPALARRFTPVRVPEPTPEEAERMLSAVVKPRLEKAHGVAIDENAVAEAVRLTVAFVPDRRLPDKARDALESAAVRAASRGAASVGPRDVAEAVAEASGVPVSEIGTAGVSVNYERALSTAVFGQPEAVKAVAGAVRRYMVGLSSPGRPIGSFLFLGPTGVGKTEMAKAAARLLFGSPDRLVRLDMSEFYDRHTASRLIGAPPGYVGHGEGGQLTEPVRRKRHCVVLLDEIDKACEDALLVVMQAMDEGRLSDSSGRVVDFTNTLLVMTTNLGYQAYSGADPADEEAVLEAQRRAIEIARASMRPEFFNRLTPVPFRPLTVEVLESVARRAVDELLARVARGGGRAGRIEVHCDPEVIRWIASAGYDPALGARPVRRLVEEDLASRVAEALASARGVRRVSVRMGPGEPVVEAG